MKTSDLIVILRTAATLVSNKVHNAKVPTKNAATGEVDVPFIWVKYRNDIPWGLQNCAGEQPMGKLYDVECVGESMDQAEAVRDQVYGLHGFDGAMGSAHADRLSVEDQSDEYVVRSAPEDSGLFVCALLIQIIGE